MKLRCNLFGHNFPQPQDRYEYVECKNGCGTSDRETLNKWKDTFWDSDVWAFLKTLLTMLLVIATLFVVLGLVINTIVAVGENLKCNSYMEMGIPAQYNYWTGCMANHPKFGWVPVSEYFRILNVNIP